MKNFFEDIWKIVSVGSKPQRAANARPWLANAIIESFAVRSAARPRGDSQWQIVQAPAFVRVFRRGGNGDDRSPQSSILRAGFLFAVCLIAIWPGACDAQVRCREGRAADGKCVDVALAETARLRAIIFSQPKISYTAYPVLPSADSRYRYPDELIPDPLKPGATGTLPPAPPPPAPIL